MNWIVKLYKRLFSFIIMNPKTLITTLLKSAGVEVNGNQDWDIIVKNERLYKRILRDGNLGLGESYMDGWWGCKRIDLLFDKILRGRLERKVRGLHSLSLALKAILFNLQNKEKAKEVGKKHYDVGNDLYKLMLDKYMMYSCAYWKTAKTLDQAQEDKLRLICEKLKLKKDERVLDIGCGWGGFARYAAQKYKVKVVGITISEEQAKLAKELCKGLDVEIRLQDYRLLNEKFDKIVSIGMFEHVGVKNYKDYFKVVSECLNDQGLFLLHTIGRNTSVHYNDPWFHKYIFPNAVLPSAKQIAKTTEGVFILEDWHSFGVDYHKTALEWMKKITKNWDKLKSKYDDRFYRMWEYYLMSCAGTFKARRNQLWQIVFSKFGVYKGYESVK